MSKPKKLRKLIKSAKMGKPSAMYRLGLFIQLGGEYPENMTKAAEWICLSADAGYVPASEWLSDFAFDDSALVQAES